jgi:hypothetical protein
VARGSLPGSNCSCLRAVSRTYSAQRQLNRLNMRQIVRSAGGVALRTTVSPEEANDLRGQVGCSRGVPQEVLS